MKKIVAIGDSITFGYPMGKEYSWTAAAERLLGIPILNQGVSGDETLDVLNRLEEDVISLAPDLVILSIGGNDAFRQVPLETAKRNINAMIERLRAKKIPFWFGETVTTEDDAASNRYIEALNRFLSETCGEIIPFHEAILGYEDSFVDGIHPTIKGYERMGRVFQTFYLEHQNKLK